MADAGAAVTGGAALQAFGWMKAHRRGLAVFAVLAIVVAIGATLSNVFNPVLLALLVAYILNPIVNAFERLNINRRAICVVFVATFFWCVSLGAILLYERASEQLTTVIALLESEPRKPDINGNGIVDEDLKRVFATSETDDTPRQTPMIVQAFTVDDTEVLYPLPPGVVTYSTAHSPFARKSGVEYLTLPRDQLERADPGKRALGRLAFEDYFADGTWQSDETLLVWKDDAELYGIEQHTRTEKFERIPDDVEPFVWGPEHVLRPAEYDDLDGDGKFDAGLGYQLERLADDVVAAYNARNPEAPIVLERIFADLRGEYLSKERSGELATATYDVVAFVVDAVSGGIMSLAIFLFLLVLVPMYTFFFLFGMNRMRDGIIAYLPGRHRQRIIDLLVEIHFAMKTFFRGRFAVCLIVGVLTGLGLWAIGMPFILLLAIVNAIAIIVPFASTVVGLLPAVLIAAALHDPEAWPLATLMSTIIAVAALYLLIQMVEQFFLTPTILGKEVELHPVVLLVSLFIGAELLGFFGVLIAVPVAAVVKILGREFLIPQLKAIARRPPDIDLEPVIE